MAKPSLTIQDNGGDAVILMGADSIVFVGTASAALDSSDFISWSRASIRSNTPAIPLWRWAPRDA